ncbi:alanyl-tRNA synthetase [Coriobacterium glomerans PW2]|uniref:Alanine--tRNA ligase n=1 Tax=Coriobacterium glomerans (strain ATCC 49209 / DSM 20642 / JCM 10262 / PW2) TaxID=700015 RepID=F2N801_CORGP|nr:alanine--tRNA ligase [Coriobacterium glomerans]AEB07110.1 alanyl-tRNA synthetase [Coriobacterium glomerans PW2]
MAAPTPPKSTSEIRASFLDFFERRGCKVVPSSSLLPEDPSLLLANAGMNQFKQYYLGKKTMREIGAASCQKCIRTTDIDIIGSDGRHLSFFEMLGNFSFGGVTKEQACAWAYEFSTEVLKLAPHRLHFTIFDEDEEAHEIWRALGVSEDHISRLGAEDNFWAAGPTGPCGPCSEIYYDQGEAFGCGSPTCAPGCECDRYLEFWNLVFTRYDRQADGSMPELPHRNLDTGMGIERVAAIVQHASSNYEGDVLSGLIALGVEISGRAYDPLSYQGDSRSLRIIADHSRAATFMLADGIRPSNEGRGYVLRRLIRRAVMHGRLLGIEGAFLSRFARSVIETMGPHYSELIEHRDLVVSFLASEEERFFATIDNGSAFLEDALAGLARGDTLDGRVAFTLHDTFGFPIDLTIEIARDRGISIDEEGFDNAMTEQRERARAQVRDVAWSSFDSVWIGLADTISPTAFVGYDNYEAEARIVAIILEDRSVDAVEADQVAEIVLDRTPFFGERGGQIGDTGTLLRPDGGTAFVVERTEWRERILCSHVGRVGAERLSVGDTVIAQIDVARRERIRRNHTATHLLHAALRGVLGEHVAQEGSFVDDERLRFDFTHFSACTADQLAAVEDRVNDWIFEDLPVATDVMDLEEAKSSGALALFSEKYSSRVRVVSCGTASRELCGGTHAHTTSQLGIFKILSESSVGTNTRRIEAVSSAGARSFFRRRLALLDETAEKLRVRPEDVPARVSALERSLRETSDKLRRALVGDTSDAIDRAIGEAVDAGGYALVVARIDGLDPQDLRGAWDTIRKRSDGPVAAVLAGATSKRTPVLIAAGDEDAVHAGFDGAALIKRIAPKIAGGGGGRPAMAQAGGKETGGIDAALSMARTELLERR